MNTQYLYFHKLKKINIKMTNNTNNKKTQLKNYYLMMHILREYFTVARLKAYFIDSVYSNDNFCKNKKLVIGENIEIHLSTYFSSIDIFMKTKKVIDIQRNFVFVIPDYNEILIRNKKFIRKEAKYLEYDDNNFDTHYISNYKLCKNIDKHIKPNNEKNIV